MRPSKLESMSTPRPLRARARLLIFFLLGICASNGALDVKLLAQTNSSVIATTSPPAGITLRGRSAVLLTDNDDAFRTKIDMIRSATVSIDAAYYIYTNDESSSFFSQELIAAAKRGAHVRLLVDLWNNYKYLDLFDAMQREGAKGQGHLEVRFYNRPTRNMVMDAAYATLPCPSTDKKGCAEWKSAEIERRVPNGLGVLNPFVPGNITASEVGNSGLFLSGLYTQDFNLMSFAVKRGQSLDTSAIQQGDSKLTPKNIDKFTTLAKVFWTARAGRGFQRFIAGIKLSLARAIYGEVINPIYDTISAYLPVDSRNFADSARDWEHMQDSLHQKFLLVDRRRLVVGGRNVENAYHMHPNNFTHPNRFTGVDRVFRDTDLALELEDGGAPVQQIFESLWSFVPMVATLDDIRAVAPNDFAANLERFKAARARCAKLAEAGQEKCVKRVFRSSALPLEARITRQIDNIENAAARYARDYHPAPTDPARQFPVDRGSALSYLANLPFSPGPALSAARRVFDPTAGDEAATGKAIHAHLADALEKICPSATAEQPQQVVIHSAYVLMPSRLMAQLGRMLTGQIDCRHVTVTVLTNSRDTTDLSVMNQINSHVLAALLDHVALSRDPARAATFRYYEYQRQPGVPVETLHSKVWVLGDDVFIGSANADTRSFMMDSNNGILIHDAPALVSRYLAFIDLIRNDRTLVKELTEAYAPAARDKLVEQDLSRIRGYAGKLGLVPYLSEVRWITIGLQFRRIVDQAFALTQMILRGGSEGRSAGERFDRKFKMI